MGQRGWRPRQALEKVPAGSFLPHVLAQINQHLIGSCHLDQAKAREFNIQDDIHRQRHDPCKNDDVDPAPFFIGGCVIADEHGAHEAEKAEQ